MDDNANLRELTELAARVRVTLRTFYRDSSTTDADEALELESWLDVLSSVAVWEFKDAWAEYQRSGPRSERGALHKPDAGAIRALVMGKRKAAYEQKRLAAPPPPAEPERPRVDAHAAEQILARAGFTPQRFAAVRAAPMARTLDEAMTRAAEPPAPHWSEGLPEDHPQMVALREARQKALANLPGARG